MRKIVDYRKILGVDKNAELQELKTVYRTLMKNWHQKAAGVTAAIRRNTAPKATVVVLVGEFIRRAL